MAYYKSFTAKLKSQAKSETAEEEKVEVDTKGKTYLQLLKEKRDYKRRRQKYRAKNVHITRRTPTEVSIDVAIVTTSWSDSLLVCTYVLHIQLCGLFLFSVPFYEMAPVCIMLYIFLFTIATEINAIRIQGMAYRWSITNISG